MNESRSDAVTETAAQRQARAEVQQCRRRLIYNNDGDDIGMPGADTVEGFLSKRTTPLLGTQVDTIFLGTGETLYFHHITDVAETYDSFEPDGSPRDLYALNMKAHRTAGRDTLSMIVNFCHANGLEAFASHRMNDVHDAVQGEVAGVCRWKQAHPHCLMGSQADQDRAGDIESPRWWWTALDFEQPEVSDYLCRIQADVCARYDIDGYECDYFRNPMFFRANLDFEPATDAQVRTMTGLHRRLRNIHVRRSEARGRPLLTAARIPATEAMCLHIGIDVRCWLAEGLVDLLIVSGGYLPFTEPVGELIALAHEFGVPAYPSMNTPIATRQTDVRVEALRGAAANAFSAGADGLQLFNCFDNWFERPYVMDIGDRDTLEGKDKLFLIDHRGWTKGGYGQAIEQSHGLPLSIPGNGEQATAHLPIGDDIPAATQSGRLASATLRVRIRDACSLDAVDVRLNGQTLPSPQMQGEWVVFHPAPALFRHGTNEVCFRAGRSSSSGDRPVDVTGVQALVKYR